VDFPEAMALINVVVFSAAAALNGLWAYRAGRAGRDWGLIAIPAGVGLISVWTAVAYALILAGQRPFEVNVTMLRPAMLLIGLVFLAGPSYLHTVRQSLGQAVEIREVLTEAQQCREQLAAAEKRLVDLEQTNRLLGDAYRMLKKDHQSE
jgi:hypothetical protein